MADRLHEVRLAEARAAADEKRVVLSRRLVGDAEGGRVREPVRRARHEVLERVRRIQAAHAAPGLGRDLLRVDGGPELAVGAEVYFRSYSCQAREGFSPAASHTFATLAT